MMNTHAHIASWAIAIILFIIVFVLLNGEKSKGVKIVHMTLRLFYLFILATGLMLLFSGVLINGEYIGKAILGFLVIGFMEMILTRKSDGRSSGLFWVLLIIVLILTIALGMRLPLGIWHMS